MVIDVDISFVHVFDAWIYSRKLIIEYVNLLQILRRILSLGRMDSYDLQCLLRDSSMSS